MAYAMPSGGQKAVARLHRRLVLVYSAVLGCMLLMPFRFSTDGALLARNLQRMNSLWWAESLLDLSLLADSVQNVLLFIPLGFFLVSGGWTRHASLAAGIAVSLTAETLQIFSPVRCASLFDLAANTAGTWLGAVAGHAAGAVCLRWTGALLARGPGVCAGGALAAAGYVAAVCLVYVPVMRPGLIPWRSDLPLFAGGMPGEPDAWRGVLARATFQAAGGPAGPDTVLDLDFRGGPRPGVLHAEAAQAAWDERGLRLEGTPVRLSDALARAVTGVAGQGAPFSATLVLHPLSHGHGQQGSVIALGPDRWSTDFAVAQSARTIACFVRTTTSGYRWNKPALLLEGAVEHAGVQQWTFLAGRRVLRGVVDGAAWPEACHLAAWVAPAGLLVASPIVVEPLTLYTLLLLPCAVLAARALVRARRGPLVQAAVLAVGPAALIAVAGMLCGVPLDRRVLGAVPFSAGAGWLLGQAWACAPGGRDATVGRSIAPRAQPAGPHGSAGS